jgi:Na+-transporting methylmalonyl-CoA/oxaloacetate decarboxylase gamma subunit
MGDSLVVPLTVSGIGMLTLFLALAVLYGLIYLMTAVTRGRRQVDSKKQAGADTRPPEEGLSKKCRAAVIAVALARAERERGATSSSGDGAAAGITGSGRLRGPWWMFHHQRRLTLQPRARRPR